MEREKIKLDRDLSVDLCQGGNNNDYTFIEDAMVDHKRWSVVHRIIVQRADDGKFFKIYYYLPATESQECEPFNEGEPIWTEVFPITRTATFYE